MTRACLCCCRKLFITLFRLVCLFKTNSQALLVAFEVVAKGLLATMIQRGVLATMFQRGDRGVLATQKTSYGASFARQRHSKIKWITEKCSWHDDQQTEHTTPDMDIQHCSAAVKAAV